MDNKWFLAQGYNSHTENCKRLHCVLRFRLVSFAIPNFLPPFFKKTAGIEKMQQLPHGNTAVFYLNMWRHIIIPLLHGKIPFGKNAV